MIVWDENKRKANLAKHGVDFGRMSEFDWDTVSFLETQIVEGEQREVAIGRIGDRLHVVVYAERRGDMRVVSLRLATRAEALRWLRQQNEP